MTKRIGIIAGSGQFPFLVAQGAQKEGAFVAICGFHGNTDPDLEHEAHAFTMLHLGQFGSLITFFQQHKVTHICMAGAINKPNALQIRPDLRAAKILYRLARAKKGDDAILRAVAEELQSEGFSIVKPDALAPSLRSNSGILTKCAPSQEVWQDIRFGLDTARTLGALDIGQCVAVRSGIIVAVEAIEGTDIMLTRAGDLGGPACVAVKMAKPGQDERLDLPSIGAQTITLLARYNFAALAFEAERTLFFDRENACNIADQHGITLVALPSDADAFLRNYLQ